MIGKGKDYAHKRDFREPRLDDHMIMSDLCFVKTAAGNIEDAKDQFHSILVSVEKDSGMIMPKWLYPARNALLSRLQR